MKYFLYFIAILLLGACATQKLPEGGGKDVYAPKILTQYPENLSTEVQSRYMAIEFDEFFKLDNPNKNVHISPRMKNKPEFEIKGKKLYIEFQEDLKPNTTYIVSFNKAIKDYTEGNDTSFQIIFSTGKFLDSASLNLEILDARTGKGKKDMTVMLFPEKMDSIAYSGEPSYIFTSDENGKVGFRYIPEGTYQALAIMDENSNLKYDRFSEEIAFWELPLYTQDSIIPKSYAFKENDTSVYLNDWRFSYPNKFKFIFNQETNAEISFHGEISSKKMEDTIVYYSHVIPNEIDSFSISYIENPNHPLNVLLESKTDTLELYYEKPKNYKIKPYLSPSKVKKGVGIPLVIDGDIERLDSTKLMLFKDSVKIDFSTKAFLNFYYLFANWEEGARYQLIVKDSSVFDVFGFTNDSLSLDISIFPEPYEGKLILALRGLESYLIEIRHDNGNLVKTFSAKDLVSPSFDLAPGKYVLSAYIDADASGKWSPGIYPIQQAETYIYYPEQIVIKSGWDTEIQWNFK